MKNLHLQKINHHRLSIARKNRKTKIKRNFWLKFLFLSKVEELL